MTSRNVIATVMVVVGMLCGPRAFAHRVNVFAWCEEDGAVRVEASFFPGGKPVVNGKIRLETAAGKVLFEGTVDAVGKARFPLPPKARGLGDLRVVLDAGMGHRAEWIMKADELIFPETSKTTGESAGTKTDSPSNTSTVSDSPSSRRKGKPSAAHHVDDGIPAWRVGLGLALIGVAFGLIWVAKRLLRKRREDGFSDE